MRNLLILAVVVCTATTDSMALARTQIENIPPAISDLSNPSRLITAEELGAIGDGLADDTPKLQNGLDMPNAIVVLAVGKTYKITRSLIVRSHSGIIGNGTIYMPASYFDCRNPGEPGDRGCRYADNAAGINISGQTRSPYTPNIDIVLADFILRSEKHEGRAVDGIVGLNVRNLKISNIEIFGFPMAKGIRLATVRGNSSIEGTNIHDFTDNSKTWTRTSAPQLTCIEIDNDLTNGLVSDGLVVVHNRCKDITPGPDFIAAYGDQTDAYNFVGSTNTKIIKNRAENVGECVDLVGGSDNLIIQNDFINCRYFGIKLGHGAQRNMTHANTIKDSGLSGLRVYSSKGDTADTADNRFVADIITNVDPAGQYSANMTGCILVSDSNDPTLLIGTKNNQFEDTRCDLGANGKFVYIDFGTVARKGSGNTLVGVDPVGVGRSKLAFLRRHTSIRWSRKQIVQMQPASGAFLKAAMGQDGYSIESTGPLKQLRVELPRKAADGTFRITTSQSIEKLSIEASSEDAIEGPMEFFVPANGTVTCSRAFALSRWCCW